MKILIVDDNEDIRISVGALLNVLLKDVIFEDTLEINCSANDGRRAIEINDEQNPDLIIMDVRMPEVDGIIATETIKKTDKEVKIIVFSTDYDYRWQAIKAGADKFVWKGAGPAFLCNIVRELIRENNIKFGSAPSIQ